MIDEATYDQLDRYFHSAMSEQEGRAFEAKMNADEKLRAEFDWLNNMLGGMKFQGRSVMKQTIATATSGIPSGEMVKYKPSINGKSFLRKWWVAITVTFAVIIVAVAVYKYVTRHIDPTGYDTEGHSMDVIPLKDSALDSCMDALAMPPMGGSSTDSTDAQSYNDSPDSLSENVIVKVKGVKHPEIYYDVDTVGKHAPITVNGYTWQAGQNQQAPMRTTIIQGPPPYTYELTDKLILKSNYNTTAGFVFTGKGDTFYMTDNSQQHFMLLKGKGELPLTPLRVGFDK